MATATLVVLPSYNERLNIVELTDAILDVDLAEVWWSLHGIFSIAIAHRSGQR